MDFLSEMLCKTCFVSGFISILTLGLLWLSYRKTLNISKKLGFESGELDTVDRRHVRKPPSRRRPR